MNINKVLILLLLSSVIMAQDLFENKTYLRHPIKTSDGIIFTDNYNSKIYQYTNGKISEILETPNCGSYLNYDPKTNSLLLKLIDKDLLQAPAVFELNKLALKQLNEFVEYAGQPTVSNDGHIVFSINNEIVIQKDGQIKKIKIDNYSNLTPISPNSEFIAYNDKQDQIWILNINSGLKEKISDLKFGYFNPKWSPDSKKIIYCRLDGTLYLYDLSSKKSLIIGNAENASWFSTSDKIIYCKKEIIDMKLINSDIFIYDLNSNTEINLTKTQDVFEIDPSIISDHTILFSTINTQEIYSAKLDLSDLSLNKNLILNFNPKNRIKYYEYESQLTNKLLDVPYVNQVYDTPDWFNGHSACGATTAIQLIAYYKVLPPWETVCSTPYYHYNNWGNYVSERYRFKFWDYVYPAQDPNKRDSYGGFGYTWNGGSPYSKLANYYTNHGIPSLTKDAPPYSDAVLELNNNKPYSICNGLTTSGHIVLAHSLGSKQYSVVTNDPYGNKNNPGYPNYTGKNAIYDWPGYNNGYKNFSTVYWCTSSSYVQPAVSDSIIEDMQFNYGFNLNTKIPSNMYKYYETSYGLNNHCWWVWTLSSSSYDTSYAIWNPKIIKKGVYELYAYIHTSTCTNALYKVYHKDGMTIIPINQKDISKNWISLGKFNFNEGTSGYVRLGDGTGKLGEKIVFDALKYIFIDSVFTTVENGEYIPNEFHLSQNYPNPFNPMTTISYEIPTSPSIRLLQGEELRERSVSLRIYDILGRVVETLVNEQQNPGKYSIQWNASKYSSGIYYYELVAGDFRSIKKMILMK